jgi:hypothetical protein
MGYTSYYLACQRFYNFAQLGTRAKPKNEEQQLFNQFVSAYNQSENYDQSTGPLPDAITRLTQDQLNTVLSLCSELIGDEFRLLRMQEDHPLSPYYIAVGDYNLSYSSSGSRLLLLLFAIMANDAYNTILIDEPELGLTPALQTRLANYIYYPANRQKYFLHLQSMYIATHSHLFLDRGHLSNNFRVVKSGTTIDIDQIETINDLHNLQFNLLGNTF